MGWKNLPSWLKGGIIAVGLELLFFIIFLITEIQIFESSLSSLNSVFGILSMPLSILFWGLLFGDDITSTMIYLSYILNIVLYFIIGVLISWFYSKLKKSEGKR